MPASSVGHRTLLVWSRHDRGTASCALGYLRRQSRAAYQRLRPSAGFAAVGTYSASFWRCDCPLILSPATGRCCYRSAGGVRVRGWSVPVRSVVPAGAPCYWGSWALALAVTGPNTGDARRRPMSRAPGITSGGVTNGWPAAWAAGSATVVEM